MAPTPLRDPRTDVMSGDTLSWGVRCDELHRASHGSGTHVQDASWRQAGDARAAWRCKGAREGYRLAQADLLGRAAASLPDVSHCVEPQVVAAGLQKHS